MAWLKARLEEYLKVRPMMEEDFYPLTQVSDRKDIWSAAQFDRPSRQDGMLQFFRRENAPYEKASFPLFAVDEKRDYVFTDADSGEECTLPGAELKERDSPLRSLKSARPRSFSIKRNDKKRNCR